MQPGAPDGWTPALAESFDRLSERWIPAYVDHACALAAAHPGEQALDVGTGTGRLARALGAQLGGSGKVLGVDVSEAMLAVADARSRKLGLTPHVVRFQVGEARALPVADASVDVVTALFVLAHVDQPAAAVGEMARVLRPRGRVVVGVGAAPAGVSPSVGRYLLRRVRDRARGLMGRSLEAPGVLLEVLGIRREDEAGLDVRDLLEDGGFTDLRVSWRGGIADVEDPVEFWEISRTFSSAARGRLAALDDEDVARVRSEVLRRCRQVRDRGGRLVYPHGAALLRARLA